MEPCYTVIIPARNAGPGLAELLAALSPGAVPARSAEVLVVDDGSTDATAEVARGLGARVIAVGGVGPAAARNAGARAARGEFLVFLDADCVPEAGCLESLLAPFEDGRVAGVRGGYTTGQRALVARFVQMEMEEKQARLATSRRVTLVDTACAAYRRSLFLDQGGFDERLPATSVEDAEFSFRLAARGERLVYAPEARVRHRHPEGLCTYLFRKIRFGYYRARLYRRYPTRMLEDGYTPRLMSVQIGLSGVLVAETLLGPWHAGGSFIALSAGLAFLGTTLPLARRAWPADRRLAVLVPPLSLARSLAQGVGLLAGFASMAIPR